MSKEGKIVSRYDKRYLAPFGERLPWPFSWKPLSRLASLLLPGLSPLYEGQESVPLLLDSQIKVGAPICIQGLYSEHYRDMANRGADLFVDLANLHWLGNGNMLHSFVQLIRARGLEMGRSTFLINFTGPSIGFDATGREIGHAIGPTDYGFARWTVPIYATITPYARWGDLWLLPFLALFLVDIFFRYALLLYNGAMAERATASTKMKFLFSRHS